MADMVNITVTPQDMAAVAQADPLVAEKLKTAALIRMLAASEARVAELEAKLPEPSENGTSDEPVPVKAKRKTRA